MVLVVVVLLPMMMDYEAVRLLMLLFYELFDDKLLKWSYAYCVKKNIFVPISSNNSCSNLFKNQRTKAQFCMQIFHAKFDLIKTGFSFISS